MAPKLFGLELVDLVPESWERTTHVAIGEVRDDDSIDMLLLLDGGTLRYVATLDAQDPIGIVPAPEPFRFLARFTREVLATNTPAEVHLGRIAKPAVRCSLHDSLALAEAKMVEYGSHYVVVCDDGGTPRGIIGIMDLARYEDARQAANVLFRIAGREVRS